MELIWTSNPLCKLFSALVRQERFCGGNFGALCEDGTIVAMLRRLEETRRQREPTE